MIIIIIITVTVTVNNVEYLKLECGPMPNLIVALPNIGGAFCSMPPKFD